MKRRLAVVLSLFAGALSMGCAPLPVVNLDHEQVQRDDGKQLSLDDMEHAIRMAALMEEWKPEVVAPGHIVATRRDDDNAWTLSVDITYSATEYSVDYKDSHGLDYNPVKHVIAHHAHGMIGDLQDRIRDAVKDIVPAGTEN